MRENKVGKTRNNNKQMREPKDLHRRINPVINLIRKRKIKKKERSKCCPSEKIKKKIRIQGKICKF